MSNDFDDIVASSLLEALAFMGETLIIGSEKVLAIVNQISFQDEFMETGGLLHNRGITAVIATPDTLPIVGSEYPRRQSQLCEGRRDLR